MGLGVSRIDVGIGYVRAIPVSRKGTHGLVGSRVREMPPALVHLGDGSSLGS